MGDIWAFDTCGDFPLSWKNEKCWVVSVDDATKYLMPTALKRKADAVLGLEFARAHTGLAPRVGRSDNGKEFMGKFK